MKTLVSFILATTALIPSGHSQLPNPTMGAAVRPTAKDIRVHPFAEEHKDTKFKVNSPEVPNELVVTTSDRIHIYGKKFSKVVKSGGVPTGHIGKLALFPPGDRNGSLTLKKAFGTTLFFACLELPEDSLDSKQLTLKEGKTYSWSVKSENGQTTLRVVADDGTAVGSQSAPTDKVLGVGFAATVRNTGNEVDLTVSFQ